MKTEISTVSNENSKENVNLLKTKTFEKNKTLKDSNFEKISINTGENSSQYELISVLQNDENFDIETEKVIIESSQSF